MKDSTRMMEGLRRKLVESQKALFKGKKIKQHVVRTGAQGYEGYMNLSLVLVWPVLFYNEDEMVWVRNPSDSARL
jgi:hypothetical protein